LLLRRAWEGKTAGEEEEGPSTEGAYAMGGYEKEGEFEKLGKDRKDSNLFCRTHKDINMWEAHPISSTIRNKPSAPSRTVPPR
jgi:hypothetical protein